MRKSFWEKILGRWLRKDFIVPMHHNRNSSMEVLKELTRATYWMGEKTVRVKAMVDMLRITAEIAMLALFWRRRAGMATAVTLLLDLHK